MRTRFLLTLLLILFAGILIAQSDRNSSTVINTDRLYGITDGERNYEQNRTTIQIPQELFIRLEQARQNGDVTEAERINSEIEKYTPGLIKVRNNESNGVTIAPPPQCPPPYSPDWMTTDVLIRAGKVGGYYSTEGYRRTLDIKSAKDGNLYLALCTDSTAGVTHYLYFYRSTNTGLTWTNVGGIQGTGTFTSVSMTIDRKGTVNDSIRISAYYTYGTGANGNDAGVYLFSFRPRLVNDDYRFSTLSAPTTGRKFNFVSAVSDGWYYDAVTYTGVIVGEYSNAMDSCASMRFFRSTDWGINHTGVSLAGVYTGYQGDFYPVACLKRTQNVYSDSVYIAVERRFSTSNIAVRIFITPWSPTTATTINYLTTATAVYKRPSLTVRETQYSLPRQILVTYTKDGACYYSYSLTDGASWILDNTLDPHLSSTGFFTCCSSDTLTTTGCFAAVFTTAGGDSVSVRRGFPGNLSSGTVQYKLNSAYSSGTAMPVVAIYRNGTSQLADVTYAGSGPSDCWFDAENLPTGINVPIGTADRYDLEQNFPNPFNPSTAIIFSIAKPEFVKLAVYDISGREVEVMLNRQMNQGKYSIDFNAKGLSSGVYFYKLTAGNFTSVKKMILIK
ncbi:MAG: T9SS type A sorting domain-containing protein [Bacteroidetes bacterium]|nr:T9SS type A sorting domain-containing protein [Bacteroidota bacterium]